MHAATIPRTRDVVLIGGGHAHALLLRRWGMNPLAGARLTLINPGPTAPYTGMLPGHIAGHYAREALDIDLVKLARHAGARLILGQAEGIDRAAGRVHVPGRAPVAYDFASLDIGITSDLPELPGFAENAVPAKPLAGYADRWARFVEDVAAGRAAPRVVIIGGGVAGVELALASAHRLRQASSRRPEVTVLEAADRALSGLGRGARRALLCHLDRLEVELRTGITVASVEPDAVTLADGTAIAAGLVVGASGARPHGWLPATGLDLTDGYVTVDATLRSVNDQAVFAVGDCAHMRETPRPRAGVFAVRQAPVLHDNLRAALTGRRLRRYRPQRDFLKLISTGGKGAVADKWGIRLDGAWLWRLKDRIDRKFMRRLGELTPMPAPAAPRRATEGVTEALHGGRPVCGGCGAKLGSDALSEALAGLPAPARADLRRGAGDDAAVIDLPGGGAQVISTDHLRGFTEDPWLMARVTAIHALGDVWAMGAAPQAGLATVILPPLAPRLQARTLAEVMDAASAVFRAAGADVAGGHSSQGAEMTLGFTVTGLTDGPVLTKGGARPGDALVLTKPIGTGTVLAAEMALAARGEDVAACWAAMARPQDAAAARLAPVAHAMTDVTGFGLAGHVLEMLDASGCAGVLELGSVPFLPGAIDLAARGEHSTLAPENRAAALPRMTMPEGALDDPRVALVFDPQTAGGLLAAVPGERAMAVLADLHDCGAEAAIIGRIEDGPPRLTLLTG
ncbi:selenide, water dikinase SelD [Rhodobacteraceae bacterium WD3A24]|nr:selenide, water dikinase SelD [Rhodobacteraceae bacterium WD3A24]